jgi:long-subunit acyl-CoA synthetase (AMP-forming)
MYTPLKSVGKPFPPNQLQIRDDEGKILGKNQSGLIWLKGPQVFDGYYQMEEP